MKRFQPYTKKAALSSPQVPGLHVHSNLGLHVFSFSCVYHSPQVLNSNLANLVHLFFFFQKSTSQVTGEVAQSKEEMASSKATFEQRIKDLEASLEKLPLKMLS